MKYRLLGLLAFAGAACNASDALLGAGPDAGGTSASTVSQSAASQPTPSQSTTSTPTVAASDAGGCDVDPCPRTLVTPPPNMVPMAIAVDDTQVYWSAFPAGPPPIAGGSGGLVARTDEPGAVQRVGRDGGTAEFVVQGVPLGWGAIGADGTNVYWTVPSDGGSALSYPQFMDAGTGSVMRAPTDGGPSSVVASGQPWPTDVLADPGGVFWMNGSGWPVGGATIGIEDTTGSVVALPAGAPAPVVLASNQNDLQRMAIDATSVVWCANNDGTINVAPRDGGPPVVVAAYYRCGSVAVNVDGVFFVINGATYQAGSAPDKPTQIGPSGGLLAADDHHVYVATGDSIVRIATAPGADTTPVTVANDTGIMDFTVDATGIFWTTWDPIAQVGAVRMVAKGPDGTGDGSVTCPANAQVAELPSGPCTGTGGCTVHWVASCDSGIPAIPVTPPTYDCECASGAWSCTQTGGGLGLIGCTAEDASSADDGSTDDAGDASLAASADATTDADVCSAITDPGPQVSATLFDASTPPPSTGGTIESGTYLLTSVTVYGGLAICSTLNVSHEVIIAAQTATSGTSQATAIFSLGADQFGWGKSTTSGTYTTSGSTITFADTCGDAGVTQSSYTATSTTLTLVESLVTQCGPAVEVFTKQ